MILLTYEVRELLGDILEEHRGRGDIDRARQQLTDVQLEVGGKYGAKAKAVISRIRPSHCREAWNTVALLYKHV